MKRSENEVTRKSQYVFLALNYHVPSARGALANRGEGG